MADIQDCLVDLVGIARKCTKVIPKSGLYMQDLPGVTIEVANAATDEETESGIKLMEDKIKYAQEAVAQDMRGFLLPRIKSNSVIDNDTIGFYESDLQAVALEAAKYKGLRVLIDDVGYFEFYINSVFLLLDAAVTTNVLIFDLMTGTQLDSFSVTTVADVPTEVVINKGYKTNKQRLSLLVAIDSSVAGTYKTVVYSSRRGCSACPDTFGNEFISFNGFGIDQVDAIIDTNLDSISGTNGISVNYSLNCVSDRLICNMASQLAWAILHRAGSELMRELQHSRRLNSIVTVHGKSNEVLRQEFHDEYVDKINSITDNMNIPLDICFDCVRTVKHEVQIP